MIELLGTKTFIPRVRNNLISRPRLVDRLNKGLNKKLTLIIAPAGFGKTTLTAEWVAQSPRRVTWLSLDKDDNDPLRFWTYFIAALDKMEKNLGNNALTLLQSPQPPPSTSILTPLINDLVAFRGEFSLVLDDFHLIKTQEIHEALTFLLDHLPEQMHITIIARADPALPLARLRARDQLIELRASDLRFTNEEAAAFLNEVMGLNLSPEDAAALEARTEGWIAGLQLAALSMQGRSDASSFVRAFAGSNRFVLDYLVEEVFNRQPEGTLDFLLQTAILDRLCGPLCDQVTRQPGSQILLEKIERSNLFLIPLDEERRWYRFHHLFADVLRNRLQHSRPDSIGELHRRASAWYEQNGLPTEAVSHALSAQEFGRAAELLEKIAPDMIQRSELARLLAWLDVLPENALQDQPLLALYYCWGLFLSGEITQAITRLQEVESRLSKEEIKRQPEVQGHIAAMRAYLMRETGNFSATIALSNQALAYLGAEDQLLRAMVTLNLAITTYLDGDFGSASQNLTEIIAKGQSDQLAANTLSAIYTYTQLLRAQGGLEQAHQLCQDGLALVDRRGWHRFPAVGFLYLALGELLRERNELHAALEYLERGIKLGQEGSHPHILIIGHVWLAWLRQTEGDAAGSQKAIQRALQVIRQGQVSRFWPIPAAECCQARLWIVQGSLNAADNWALASGLDPLNGSPAYLYEAEYLTLTRLLIARGDLETAASLLMRLQEQASRHGRNGSLTEILILQALNFAAQHRHEESSLALEQAFTLAEPQGYMRIFVDEGEPMRKLISGLLSGQSDLRTRVYAQKLLSAFEAAPDSQSTRQSGTQNLVDPLSAREIEVLALVAEGLSNREIAQKLYLSTGTVKVHLKHIFGKLAVSSRTQAVARARELNLL